MTNAFYNKGVAFERGFIAKMQQNYIGLRTAGSHSPFDVILIPKEHGNVVLCQLKRYGLGRRKPKIPQELEQIKINEDVVTIWFVTRQDRGEIEIEPVGVDDMGLVEKYRKMWAAKRALEQFRQKLQKCKRIDDFIEAYAEYRGVSAEEYIFFKNKVVESLKKEGLYSRRIKKGAFIDFINRKFKTEVEE